MLQAGTLRLLAMARPRRHWMRLWPGLVLCAIIGMAAAYVETRWGGPKVLYALLLGMAFHELSDSPRQHAGVAFGAQTVLRLGIGFLGARITLHEVAALGWPTVALIMGGVFSTVLCVALMSRGLSLPWRIGIIAGGATAICGASAAMALSAVLARDRLTEQRTLAIVVCATTLSTVAMLGYPLLCSWWGLPPFQASLLVGGGIHDVGQVAVAGYALGPHIGDLAVVVKLLRVAMLALVVAAVSLWMRWRPTAQASPTSRDPQGSWLPWFMRIFVALALLRSIGWLPQIALQGLSDLSQCCLAVAAAAMGMRSSPRLLRQAGWPVLTAMLVGTLWLAICMLAGGYLLRGGPHG